MAEWEEPPWDTPLDVDAAIAQVPASAEITGMFLVAVVDAAKARGMKLPSARARYIPFRSYPLTEHCRVLVEAARALFPRDPLRQGLRRLGRGSPQTLVGSTLGRVMMASVQEPTDVVRAMAKSYPMHTRPGSVEVVDVARGEMIVKLRDVWYFLDSHHVGVFEGVLRFAKLEGAVTVRVHGPASADLRLLFRP